MEYDRMSFPEAVEELARLAGMEVPKEAEAAFTNKSDELAPLYDLLGKVAHYYQQQLKRNNTAIEYLKNRGMSGKTALAFGVGFAPPGWDNVLRQFGKTNEEKQRLHRTGLLIEKDGGGYYDRFRNRIMFPIRNRRGNVIGFGGRSIDPNDTPKYLNSPETLLFHKGRELYGLHEVQQQRPRANTILVVEGYMDVVMLAEHGVNNAVATLGTATTHEHIQTLFKTAPEIIFCFDGDRAGRDAAWRALETSLPEMDDRHQIKFLFLPQNEDPDSYTQKHGRDKFQSLLESSTVSLATYLFENLTSRFGKSPEGLAQLADEAKGLISKTQDNVFRQLLLKELSSITGLTVKQQPIRSSQNQHQRLQKIKLVKGDVRTLIIALLTEPSFAQSVRSPSELKLLNNPGMDLLLELIETIHSNPNMNTAMIIERYRESEHRDAISILATEEFSIPNLKSDLESLRRVFTDGIQRLLSKARDERFQQLIRKSADKTISPEEKQELQSFYEKKNS